MISLYAGKEVDLYIEHKGQVVRVYKGFSKSGSSTSGGGGGGIGEMSLREFSKLMNDGQRCWTVR